MIDKPSILCLTGNLTAAFGQVLQKKYLKWDNVILSSLYRWIVGVIIYQPIVAISFRDSASDNIGFAAIWLLAWTSYLYSEQFALVYIPQSDVSAISAISALIVNVFLPIVSEEKLKISSIIGSVLAVCGVFVVSQPFFIFGANGHSDIRGVAFAVLAAFSYAVTCLVSKKILNFNLYSLNYVLYALLTGCSVFQVLLFDRGEFRLDCEIDKALVIISSSSIAASNLLFSFAHRSGDSGKQALLGLSFVLFSIVFEMTLNSYRPTIYSLVGSAVVLFGVSCRYFRFPKWNRNGNNNEGAGIPARNIQTPIIARYSVNNGFYGSLVNE